MIVAGMVYCSALDFIDGLHQKADTYKLALYGAAADIGPGTTQYTPNGEVRGEGYNPGGVILRNRRSGRIGGAAYMTFDQPAWERATINAAGALIYNASKGNRAIVVIGFHGGEITSSLGPFEVELPPPGPKCPIRIVIR